MLLSSLEQLGYLKFERETRRYSPTVRVLLLGAWMNEEVFFQGALLVELDLLRRRLRMPIVVGMRQGIHVRLVISVRSPGTQTLFFSAGVMRPVCRSAMGKVLLARETNQDVELISRKANAVEGQEPVEVSGLLREIREVRRRGWAESYDYPVIGRATLAFPLPAFPDQPPLSIAVGTSKARLMREHETVLATMREMCARVAAVKRDNVSEYQSR